MNRRMLAVLMAAAALAVCRARELRADFLSATFFSGTGAVLRWSDAGVFTDTFIESVRPRSLAWGPDGNLYIGTFGFIRAYDGASGELLRTVYEESDEVFDGLVFTPDGDLLASARASAHAVYRIDADTGQLIATIGAGTLNSPSKLILTRKGNVLVGSAGDSIREIYRIDLATNQVSLFSANDALNGPSALDFGPDGRLYVGNRFGDKSIHRLDADTGQVLGKFAPSGFEAPADLLFVPGNKLWMAGRFSSMLRSFNATTGEFLGNASMPAGNGNSDLIRVPEPSLGGGILLATLLTLRRRR